MKRPDSYTEFFKQELIKELNKETMVELQHLAEVVSVCSTLEKYTQCDPGKTSGQFSFGAWASANLRLRIANYDSWGTHKAAVANGVNWNMYIDGRILRCSCNTTYEFRNDILENGEWACVECKTKFEWPES